ncbi:hypothetical protein ACSPJ8_002440 [Klebsiella aerogenes]|uniref:hypothetical protein n=1 Tax=Klebsiella TaxID=570 RepID=UPI0007B3DC11|nr:hypothetical protein [Klebsiella aerogenes]KZQ72973.1 hypothetical protein A3N56_06205 [Klebsiella aerogenes]MDQ8572762.1 hypothetical protein [Klebsiella aerogenes]MDQ8599118.1 hypothetical protein [Klebsiella aerogenes]HCD5424937.1 hypothetical protein [Klebsiella aerogenes]HCR0072962.1 hypothetical protein [Klebsiella aerogenes]
MKKLILLIFIGSVLSGCVYRSTAHSGRDFDETKATQIVPGKTTEADLIKNIGEPMKKEIVGDHEVKWIYEYVTSNAAVRVFSAKPKVDVTKKTLEVLIRDGVVVNSALSNPGTTQYR